MTHSAPSNCLVKLHPNDGYDLDLVALTARVKIYSNIVPESFSPENISYQDGELELANDTRIGTLELNYAYWKRIGKPDKLKAAYTNGCLLLFR